MSASVGPMLAAGAVTLGNTVIINRQPIDWRVPIATGMAAAALSLVEKAFPDAAKVFAYGVLITVLFVRTNPAVPSPAESLEKWWNS